MKHKTHYICQECGSISQNGLGNTPSCQSWNSFVEETIF